MGEYVEINFTPPEQLRGFARPDDVLKSTVSFNGRVFSLKEFLAASMSYLGEIAGTADNIRAKQMIEGSEYLVKPTD